MSVSEDLSELERVCYHEAGHVTAAHIFGRSLGPVTVVPSPAFRGLCIHGSARLPVGWRGKLGRPLPLIPAPIRRFVESEAVISLCGSGAERLRWQESSYGVSPDEQRAARLVSVLTPSVVSPTHSESRRLQRAAEKEDLLTDEDIAFRVASALAGDGLAGAYFAFLSAVTADFIKRRSFSAESSV